MFPFTTLLVPLEIARAYAEAFFPGPYVAPRFPSSQANLFKDGAATPIDSANPMSTQFYDTQVSTVFFRSCSPNGTWKPFSTKTQSWSRARWPAAALLPGRFLFSFSG